MLREGKGSTCSCEGWPADWLRWSSWSWEVRLRALSWLVLASASALLPCTCSFRFLQCNDICSANGVAGAVGLHPQTLAGAHAARLHWLQGQPCCHASPPAIPCNAGFTSARLGQIILLMGLTGRGFQQPGSHGQRGSQTVWGSGSAGIEAQAAGRDLAKANLWGHECMWQIAVIPPLDFSKKVSYFIHVTLSLRSPMGES